MIFIKKIKLVNLILNHLIVKKGNEVTVLTDVPNYPMGDIYKGYEKGKKRIETINGVEVHRVFTIPRKKNVFMRFLNYHGFSFFSKGERL